MESTQNLRRLILTLPAGPMLSLEDVHGGELPGDVPAGRAEQLHRYFMTGIPAHLDIFAALPAREPKGYPHS